MSENANQSIGLSNISDYIEGLKFKSALVGGVDREDVLVSIREMYHLFSEAYGDMERQRDSASERADNAENTVKTQLQEKLVELKRKSDSAIAESEQKYQAQFSSAVQQYQTRAKELERKLDEQESQLDEQKSWLEKQKTQINGQKDQIEKQKTQLKERENQIADLEKQLEKARDNADNGKLQETVGKYEKLLENQRQQSVDKENRLKRLLETEQSERGNEQENARTRQIAIESELTSQIKTLQSQLALKDAELTRKDSEHARELELAKSGSAARGETLEEIYIEARSARNKALAKAQEEGDALRADTENELETLRTETQRELDNLRADVSNETAETRRQNEQAAAEAQEKARQLISEAERTAAELKAAARQFGEENEAQCRELNAKAEQTLADAKAEAAKIVAEARRDYQREREKYNVYLLKLSELKSRTVNDLQNSVSRLNTLMFELSGAGIQANTASGVELSQIDEAIADMERKTKAEVVRNNNEPDGEEA